LGLERQNPGNPSKRIDYLVSSIIALLDLYGDGGYYSHFNPFLFLSMEVLQ